MLKYSSESEGFGKEERKIERLSSREDGTLNFSPMNVLPPLSIYYIC
jgi:hypothetical protein